MLSIIINWCVMFISMLILGKMIFEIMRRKGIELECTWDMCVIMGMIFTGTYSQIFSLFYKVGKLAWVILGVMIFVSLYYLVKHVQVRISLRNSVITNFNRLIMCLAVIFCGAIWTSQSPDFIDTYLYHAQAIRWVEEYGAVPGLGNLHNRFAYNSSFFPLQALYSFSWLGKQSLHSLNGFVCVFFSIYSIYSLKFNKKNSMSNLLKIALFIYAFMNRNYFSSTTSDMLSLLLFIWLNIKWTEKIEEGSFLIDDAIVLALIGVFAITVKLSVLACVIFLFYPIFMLVRQHNWKKLLYMLFGCLLIGGGFIARNIMISGYLLYPYSEIDLFSVDWKMPSSVVDYDSMTIAAWGRGVKDVDHYSDSILQWFPTWFNSEGIFYRTCFIIGAVAVVILLLFVVYSLIKKRNYQICILISADILGLIVWLFGSPLFRYGIVFLFIPPCILLGLIKWTKKIWIIVYALFIPGYLLLSFATFKNWLNIPIVWEHDYEYQDGYCVEKNDKEFYIPQNGLIGYHLFPSTPYANQLDIIEMRGKAIEDGFKVRDIKKKY